MKSVKSLSLVLCGGALTYCGTKSSSEEVTICSIEVDQGIYDHPDLNNLLGSPLSAFSSSARNALDLLIRASTTLTVSGSDENVDKGDTLTIKLSSAQVNDAFTNDTTYISLDKVLSQNEGSSIPTLDGACKKEGTLKVSEMTPSIGSTKLCTVVLDKEPYEGLFGKAWKKASFSTTSIYSPALMPIESNPNGLIDAGDQVALYETSKDGSGVQADGTVKVTFNEIQEPSMLVEKLTGTCAKGGTLKVSEMTPPTT